MSVRAGSIITVAGRNVVDRLQSAGQTGQVPIQTVREIGNDQVVDKVPTEADFTWSMESWDVTTDLLAFLHGKVGNQVANQPPGYGDADGTEYHWEDCQFVNLTSPWKSDTGVAGGHIGGGLIIPGYYPTRLSYNFGVTDMAACTIELAGGSFYYAKHPPVEEYAVGDGAIVAYATSEAAVALRLGGGLGTSFQRVFGVIVAGELMIKDVDYVESIVAAEDGLPHVATITFTVAPALGADVRFAYFTSVAKALPQAVNADATIKPGAVRGRNIRLILDPDGVNVRLPGVQTFAMDATIEGTVIRELGNPDITGRDITGTDVTGTVTFRPKDIPAFFGILSETLGVSADEVFSYFYLNTIPVAVEIENPKNPAEILKTLWVPDGQFQPPPMPARVNSPVDFAASFNAVNGTFSEFKGSRP